MSLNKVYEFHGGIKLKGHKALSCKTPISQLPLPEKLVIALRQHIGQSAKPQVSVGQKVLKGELIASAVGTISAAIHASSSGTITAIEERPIAHHSGLKDLCIEISCDGKDEWITPSTNTSDYRQISISDHLEHLQTSGIVGLGGATFPTDIKLKGATSNTTQTVIINAAECEPWISCDQILIQERAAQVIQGIEIILYLSGAKQCIIGIEDNKPDAITALHKALKNNQHPISVQVVPTIYPTGGERQLIKVLTNQEVPADGMPLHLGMVVLNIATAWAIYNFIINDRPLVSRVVTVTGDGVASPQNIEAPIGAPLSSLIAHAGGYTPDIAQLTMGGPMMGFSLYDDELPLAKACNCLLAQTKNTVTAKPKALACIRCGECAKACPAGLLPQQLYWYSRAENLETLEKFHIKNCIECGCCDYVCPSHIPLVHYFRYGKTQILAAKADQKKTDIARLRHENRENRLEKIKVEKARKLAEKKAAIAARNKKKADADPDKKNAIAEALERSKQRKLEREQQQQSQNKGETE